MRTEPPTPLRARVRSSPVLQREQTSRDFVEKRPAINLFIQAAVPQRDQRRDASRVFIGFVASFEQFFEQTTIRSDFEALQRNGGGRIVGGMKRCCAEIA